MQKPSSHRRTPELSPSTAKRMEEETSRSRSLAFGKCSDMPSPRSWVHITSQLPGLDQLPGPGCGPGWSSAASERPRPRSSVSRRASRSRSRASASLGSLPAACPQSCSAATSAASNASPATRSCPCRGKRSKATRSICSSSRRTDSRKQRARLTAFSASATLDSKASTAARKPSGSCAARCSSATLSSLLQAACSASPTPSRPSRMAARVSACNASSRLSALSRAVSRPEAS
mmetsp:Transcript_61894/g.171530  ORF Transcript_61894/g.171530 Transcript_61894/m.171530 type:complete len:233 (-) Transcript_61894:1913-2611(-)